MTRAIAWAVAVPIGLAVGLALGNLALGVPFIVAMAAAFGAFRSRDTTDDEPHSDHG